MRLSRLVEWPAATAAMCLFAVACGSSGTSAGSADVGSEPGSSQTQSARDGSGATAAPGLPSAAAARLKAATALPVFSAPGAAFDASKLRGKAVWGVTSADSDALPAAIKGGMADVGKLVGLTTKFVNGEGSASTQSHGIDLAVSQKADAIVAIAVSLSDIKASMAAAGRAGVPVLDVASSVAGGELPSGNYQHVVVPYAETGQVMADYVVANSDIPPNVLVLTGNQYASVSARDDAIFAEFRTVCPACVVEQHDIQFDTLGSSAPDTISTLLRKYPKTTWVVAAYDAIASDASAAIRQNGLQGKVRLISANGNVPNLKEIRAGGVQVADVAYPSTWMGWTAMDAAMRAVLDLPKVDEIVPVRLIDNTNIDSIDIDNADTIFGDGYVSGYKKEWGLR